MAGEQFAESVMNSPSSANGSGIGILVGRNPINFPPINAIDVMDISNPVNNNVFLTRFTLLGNAANAPVSVSIASGIAFVAARSAGLQVVNYLSFDSQGQAPAVSISTSVDLDPDVDGIQAQEGTTLPLLVEATDDVQVRNVELIVDGQVVSNDVSFPWNGSVTLPGLRDGSPSPR